MPKRTSFTTITPLPASVSREMVLEMLHSYIDIIDLNPLVQERHPIRPPSNATDEEYHCHWFSLTDRVHYLPGGILSGRVSYTVCFHDLANGLQAHYYAPFGLNVKNKWTICGSLPGEAMAPVEIGVGAPVMGLYLREDVKMTCNFIATSYVKKSLKKAHALLVSRLVARAQFLDVKLDTISPDNSPNKFQQEYEPMEFGRDGQTTEDVAAILDCFNSRVSTLSAPDLPRPSSIYYDMENKPRLTSLNLSSPTPWNTNPQQTRACSSSSPSPPKSHWQNLNGTYHSPHILKTEQNHSEEIVYEMDAQDPIQLKEEPNQIWEMGTDTEIKNNYPQEKIQRPLSLCKPIVSEPVELEGSLQT
ncbi:hypothetical protein Golomagni_02469 [Golovinomyces magnicellulatus]|nr:hypothetical protein Golomagni_02469 [Golovinomyces magnicellulatus]